MVYQENLHTLPYNPMYSPQTHTQQTQLPSKTPFYSGLAKTLTRYEFLTQNDHVLYTSALVKVPHITCLLFFISIYYNLHLGYRIINKLNIGNRCLIVKEI